MTVWGCPTNEQFHNPVDNRLKTKKIIVTGGAGFIGSNLIRHLIRSTTHHVVNVDKLTYAGNLASLTDVESSERYQFEQIDIADSDSVRRLFRHSPDAIIHLAAETHVDRSIDGPNEFIETNIVGTYNLLQSSRSYFQSLEAERQSTFRFHHVSTDEVYGSLSLTDPAFDESTAHDPRSPYSASKAGSDHLVRAWSTTYGLPVLISSSSNNYGPHQHPEKLIPLVILKAIHGAPIPVYGRGDNIRDWLYVEDHVSALLAILENGRAGETYNIGGDNERTNIDLVRTICRTLDKVFPVKQNQFLRAENPDRTDVERAKSEITNYEQLITFVADRPGHDFRYATDSSKIRDTLGWRPTESGDSGFEKTIGWYIDHPDWWEPILAGSDQLRRRGMTNSRPSTQTNSELYSSEF